MSPQQFMVLKQLQVIKTASQADLAQALGLDNSNLAAVTAELNEAGLIERYRHERDRRRYVIELSPSGAKVLAEADAAIADGEQELLSRARARRPRAAVGTSAGGSGWRKAVPNVLRRS